MIKFLQTSLFTSTLLLSGFMGCDGDRVNVESEDKGLDAVLGINENSPRLCGATSLTAPQKSQVRAKIDSFLKDSSGNETDKFISAPSKELKEFTAETLVAIPSSLLVQIFNNNVQGQIVISNSDVVTHCQRESSGNEPVYGCGIKLPGQPLKVYLREKKSIIGQKLVQLFAYAMSQNINTARTGLSLTEDLSEIKAQFQKEISTFVQLRETLLQAFTADISQVQNEATLAFQKMSHEEKLHYVFSQTADSVYCSLESMSLFRKMSEDNQFKNTYETFFGMNRKDSRSLHSIIGLPWYTNLSK